MSDETSELRYVNAAKCKGRYPF